MKLEFWHRYIPHLRFILRSRSLISLLRLLRYSTLRISALISCFWGINSWTWFLIISRLNCILLKRFLLSKVLFWLLVFRNWLLRWINRKFWTCLISRYRFRSISLSFLVWYFRLYFILSVFLVFFIAFISFLLLMIYLTLLHNASLNFSWLCTNFNFIKSPWLYCQTLTCRFSTLYILYSILTILLLIWVLHYNFIFKLNHLILLILAILYICLI